MCGTSSKYLPKTPDDGVNVNLEFKNIQDSPELNSYLRTRRDHISLLRTTTEVKNELLKPANSKNTDNLQQIDLYPKGRQYINDDEYLLIMKDIINLSLVLDDIEQTGFLPFHQRTALHATYHGLHKKLTARAR